MEVLNVILVDGFVANRAENANANVVKKILEERKEHADFIVLSSVVDDKITTEMEGIKFYNFDRRFDGIKSYFKFLSWARAIIYDNACSYRKVNVISVINPIYFSLIHLILPKNRFSNTTIYLDPFSMNKVNKSKYFAGKIKTLIDKIVYDRSDLVFVLDEMFEEYISKFDKFKNLEKVHRLALPLDFSRMSGLEGSEPKQIVETDLIRLKGVYIGRFYDDIRSPRCLLDIFDEINKDADIYIEIDIYSHIYSELDLKILNASQYVRLHEHISPDEIPKLLSEFDFVINIGNSIENQLPSKLLDYVTSLKPILNLKTITNDTSEAFLVNYPCYYSTFGEVNMVKEFLINSVDYQIDSEVIKVSYARHSSINVYKHIETKLSKIGTEKHNV